MPSARFRFLPVLAVAMLALALAGCGDPTYTWHQKMTVEVETPAGIRSGSSVIEVSAEIGTSSLSRHTAGSPVAWKIRGEAVTVDLGDGRHLFALLKGDGYRSEPGRNALFVFADWDSYDPRTQPLPADQVTRAPRDRPVALAADAYPLLVTFASVNDPITVRRVDPYSLAATLGPGYALKAITLEITDEPATAGVVVSVLGWLVVVGDGMLDGRRISTASAENRFANGLSRLDFERR